MIGHGTVPEDQHSILQLFLKLVAPTLRLKRRFFPVEDGKPAVPDAEIVPIGSDHWTSHAYQTKIRPHLDVFAKDLAPIVTVTFEEARTMLVMYEKAGPHLADQVEEASEAGGVDRREIGEVGIVGGELTIGLGEQEGGLFVERFGAMRVNPGDGEEVVQLRAGYGVRLVAKVEEMKQNLILHVGAGRTGDLLQHLCRVLLVRVLAFGDRPHFGRAGKVHMALLVERDGAEQLGEGRVVRGRHSEGPGFRHGREERIEALRTGQVRSEEDLMLEIEVRQRVKVRQQTGALLQESLIEGSGLGGAGADHLGPDGDGGGSPGNGGALALRGKGRSVERKLAGELLKAVEPQITLALAAPVYAYFFRSADLVIAEDPLLLRKHRFFNFVSPGTQQLVEASTFVPDSEGLGSHLEGGFAQFALTSGFAVASGWKQGGQGGPAVIAEQIAAIRSALWDQAEESDQRLVTLRVLAAREWIVQSAQDADLAQALNEETSGLLSLSRRADLLNGIAERDWQQVWTSITLPDLFRLGSNYLARFPKGHADTPVAAQLRTVAASNDGARLDIFARIPNHVLGCDHTHLVPDQPYEEYERQNQPTYVAERVAEFKLPRLSRRQPRRPTRRTSSGGGEPRSQGLQHLADDRL